MAWATDPPALRGILVGSAVIAVVLAIIGAAVTPGASPSGLGLLVAPATALPFVIFSRPDRPVVGIAAAILFNIEALAAGIAFDAGIAYATLLPVIGVGIAADSVRGRALAALVVLAAVSATIAIAGASFGGPAAQTLTATTSPALLVASFAVLVTFSLALAWRAARRQVVALTAAHEELEARTAAEDALQSTSSLLRAIVEASPVATIALDGDGRVRHWNHAAEQILGWSAADVLDRPLPAELLPPVEDPLDDPILRARAGAVLDGERVSARTKDGREILLDIHAAPLRDARGRPVGVAGQLVDVTSRVALEAQLAQAQKMEAVGHLAGGMAHDFNNTLTAVGGFASLIVMEAEDPEIREHAETITAAVDRARSLTRQILAFARRSRLVPQVVDVRTVVDALDPIVRRLLGSTIDVSVDARDPAPIVHVDAGQLEQALLNLALNARDAMPSGGRLDITVDRVHEPEESIVISVSDTGTGIPAEIRDRIFEPFFTTKDAGHGTGLGLAMVFGFVNQSGGMIDVHSTEGRGTTFEIRLPAHRRTPSGVREADGDGDGDTVVAGGAETIVLVEGDEDVAGFAERGLTGIGYRVVRGRDGPSALDAARAHGSDVDLLVTDVGARGNGGPDVARALRSEWQDLPVIYTTGYPDAGPEVSRREPILQKPFTLRELSKIVRRTLDEQQTADVMAHVWARPPAEPPVTPEPPVTREPPIQSEPPEPDPAPR